MSAEPVNTRPGGAEMRWTEADITLAGSLLSDELGMSIGAGIADSVRWFRAAASRGSGARADAGGPMTDALRIVRYHPRAAVGDGGMTGAIKRWSEALSLRGADLIIAYADGQPSVTAGPVRWERVRHAGLGGLRAPLDLDGVLADADLLVLHSGWTAHNARAASIARSHGVPYLLEPRGAYDPHILARHARRKRLWWTAGEGRVVEGAFAIHTFFEEERAHLEAVGFRGPIVVAPNGVDVPEQTWTGGGGYWLFLGRFDPEHKGLDVLVEAVAGLPPTDRPAIRLRGPDWRGGKATISRRIAELGLEPWLQVGPAAYGREKQDLLRQADAFVYPSRWDACPNAVLEAVAHGIPTLCGPYPLGAALAERGGAISADATPSSLREAIRRLRDPEVALRIGATGRRVVESDFQWSAVAERWLDQVVGLLRTRRAAGVGPRRRRSASTSVT